jgi:hypothetical protein
LIGNGEYAFLNIINSFCFFFVQFAGIAILRVVKRGKIITVREYGIILSAVASRNALMGFWVFNVLNSVTAEDKTPVRFGIGAVLVENIFVSRQSLVELILPSEMVRTIKKISNLFIVSFRERRCCLAVFTRPDGRTLLRLDIAAAHFAFKYQHN